MDRYANLCVPIFNFKGTLYLHLSINWHKSIVLKKKSWRCREWQLNGGNFFCVYLNLKKQKCKKVTLQEVKKWRASSRNTFFVYLICLFFPAKGEFFLPTVVKRLYIEALLKVGVLPLLLQGIYLTICWAVDTKRCVLSFSLSTSNNVKAPR